MEKIEKLSKWLDSRALTDEALEAAFLAKIASSKMTYKVRNGDNLGRIAEGFGVTVKELKAANGLSSDAIRARQVLKIPTDRVPATDDEIVAMTLLGEGGTIHGEKAMKEVLTVLLNRQDCIPASLGQHALKKKQFSFWNNKVPDMVLYNDKAYGKQNKKLWDKALAIAKAKERDADVGGSTHYWNPDIISSPGWGKEMKSVYTNSGHIYGVMMDGSKYDKCSR